MTLLRKSHSTLATDPEIVAKIKTALAAGYVHKSIAQEYDVSLATVRRINTKSKLSIGGNNDR